MMNVEQQHQHHRPPQYYHQQHHPPQQHRYDSSNQHQQQQEHDFLLQQQQDERMSLHEHELQWAHTIKNAIRESEHLQPVSDFEIAQWALVTIEDQNLDEVLERVYKLQYFREMYHFDNITASSNLETFVRVWQEGVTLMQGYIKQQQPGHLLTIDYMPSQGHYLIVWDRASFDPSRVRTEVDWRIYQGCTYCLFLILNSNLRAIREGVAVILECEGMSFRNYDSRFEERRVNELFNYYPFKNREFCFLNTPTVAIMLYKVVKPFLSKVFDKAVQLDGKIEGFEGRIDTLYNVPTFDYAQDRLLERLGGYLRERLENQKNYTLPPLDNDNTSMNDDDEDASSASDDDDQDDEDDDSASSSSSEGGGLFDDDVADELE